MAARADVLGLTGANHPDHWAGRTRKSEPARHCHTVRPRCRRTRAVPAGACQLSEQCDGVEVLSALDLEAIPPFDYAHEHFGYRDRLSQPVIEGTGVEPTPGSGPPIKPGEFFLGYPDEKGPAAGMPEPEILSRTAAMLPI